MIVIYFVLVFIVIVVSLICFKNQFNNMPNIEKYIEERSSSCSKKNSFDEIPYRSINLQDESKLGTDAITISSKEFNIDAPTIFKGQTDFTESEVSFDNVAFNNNIYIHKDVGIEFSPDVYLNSVTNLDLLKKYKNINDILSTDNCSGKWNDNGDFEIEDIFLETMSNPSHECLQQRGDKMVRFNDKDMCVYKMWRTIREGREPTDNSICDCCCPDEVVKDIYSEVRLIFVGSDNKSLLYRATSGNSLNIVIDPSWEIKGIVLRKSDDTVKTTFKAYNNDKEILSYDSTQFDNNKTMTVKPFKNINSYIPNVIYLFVRHKNHSDETKIFAIPGSQKGESFKPNRDHPGRSDLTKWEVTRVPNTTNKFYLKNKYNDEYAIFDDGIRRMKIGRGRYYEYEEHNGRFNGILSSQWLRMPENLKNEHTAWRFEWQKNPSFSGKFHIIHDRTNKVMFMMDNLDLRFMDYDDERKGEINTLWWYESDDSEVDSSLSFAKHRFTLEIS